MREIKFRLWDGRKFWYYRNPIIDGHEYQQHKASDILMQYTGLKDKNGIEDIYEDDIIDLYGLKKGNKYEDPSLLKEKTNFLIQGFGTACWEATNKEAMERGCYYS